MNPPFQSVSAMALMQFLDSIPQCTEDDWDGWDMQDLIDDTNAKLPGRITPVMEAQLLKGLQHLEKSPEVVKSITGWEWIITSVSNAN